MKSLTHVLPCTKAGTVAGTSLNAITRCLYRTPIIASIITSACVLAPSAQASEDNQLTPHSKKTLERIVVQAQKTSQNLQDVPVAVTALSGQDLVETVSRV